MSMNAPIQNCWKRIGVWGTEQPRCERLETVIHCRNCEVFTQAGRSLLERELPEGYVREWTEVFAAKKQEEPAGAISLLIFRIGPEWLALPALLFAEIVEPAPAHKVPHRRNPALLGVVNVHGEVQLCVSLRHLLGIQDDPQAQSAYAYRRMVVLQRGGRRWVFPADEIHGIQRISPTLLQPPPVTVSKSGAGFSRGIFVWEGRHVALLDDELVLYRLSRSVQ
jgi:chemotaxis-related protein WspD